jgi:hypothetical protein
MSKFAIGQTVDRIQGQEPTQATIVSVETIDNTFVYKIQYIEGATDGNDGFGYWTESSLI